MEYLFNMLLVHVGIVGVDEYIIEINDNTNIKHVRENVVHESLESSWGVS
jgi:hypothetical protein